MISEKKHASRGMNSKRASFSLREPANLPGVELYNNSSAIFFPGVVSPSPPKLYLKAKHRKNENVPICKSLWENWAKLDVMQMD